MEHQLSSRDHGQTLSEGQSSSSLNSEEKRGKIEQANDTSQQFIKLYYDRLDTARHKIGKIYLDNATMSWNGTKLEGIQNIQTFLLDKIPSPSEHLLHSLDAQPVMDSAAGQTTIVVQVAGAVKYQGKKGKPFQQNFLITAQDDKWKVVTDVFRHAEHYQST